MTIQVKICGINSREAYHAASSAGADWVGFVFFHRSPRFVTAEQAAAIASPIGPLRVGLFVDPTPASIEAVLAQFRLDVLQLYADEEICRDMRLWFNIPVWRAVGVSARADLPENASGVDAMVIEAKAPAGAERPGGNAKVLDWEIMHGWHAPGPWLLAGGLTPENVAAAIATSGAKAVDVSSGVEIAPGIKSSTLINDFIRAARSA